MASASDLTPMRLDDLLKKARNGAKAAIAQD
jgi:hypothetical protein